MSDEQPQPQARRVIRGWKGVEAYSGLRRSQMWELIKRGDWPPPTKILGGMAVVWFEDEVAAAQERLFERGASTPDPSRRPGKGKKA